MTNLMSQVNFKLLHAFIAIAHNGSFRQAAELLNRSQSAISMQIRQLEEQLGVPLFHRTTRRVRLTQEGERLLVFAQRALTDWESGLRQIREAADIMRGTLAIACVPTVAATRLPKALALFQADYPGISIRLRELAAEELFDSVRRQEVDFAIGPEVDQLSEFTFVPFANDPIHALTSPAYPIGRKGGVSLAALCRVPVLLSSRSSALRRVLDRELAARNLSFDVKFEVLHVHTLFAFVAHGLGVAIMPKLSIPESLDASLRSLRISDPPLTRTINIVTLRGQSLSPAARKLSDIIVQTFRDGANPRARRASNR